MSRKRRRDENRRHIPHSKRIENNPHAVKGKKIAAFEGGVIVSRQNPDGNASQYAIDEYGRRTPLEPGDRCEDQI